MSSNSAQHWNNCQMVVIDTETTGLDAQLNEIWQICFLPLDANCEPRTDVQPFYTLLKPESPELIDYSSDVMSGNKAKIQKALQTGMDPEKAADYFEEWVGSLDLRYNKWGTRARLLPLAQNYLFDYSFIRKWMGIERYEEFFHVHYRDTMATGAFLNDHASFQVEKIPYPKLNLSYLLACHGENREGAHDALSDCIATAWVYRQMCLRRLA